MFNKVLGIPNMMEGMAYQWSDDAGQLLSYSICNHNSARNNGHEVGAIFLDLGEAIELGRDSAGGVKSFVGIVI